ncbi:hypothetical protein E2562_000259 [Oryza meyeriana var. granulata]|uniref:Uncharacterized protein n=1 Tax=Oryza meyeriana var. granulata TaxID=110450 RepID=A0A6G1CMT1_9ORYZ|nr:hypothetical protein E2562_000259 [Oryza meyeriana var. granulata]
MYIFLHASLIYTARHSASLHRIQLAGQFSPSIAITYYSAVPVIGLRTPFPDGYARDLPKMFSSWRRSGCGIQVGSP